MYSVQSFNKTASIILILALIAKSISIGIFYFLPKDGIDFNLQEKITLPYHGYRFSKTLGLGEETVQKSQEAPKQKEIFSIDDMVLKAVYVEAQGGFIFVTHKSDPNTTVLLNIGDEFKGYRLESVKPKEAIFSMLGKEYRLVLQGVNEEEQIEESISVLPATNTADEAIRVVPKQGIDYYTKNLKAIWSNISIKEHRENGQIQGFKITEIKPNSLFAKLGLEAGDIIVAVNNKEIKSFAQAFGAYKELKDSPAIKLTVLRNGVKKDFEYEVM